MKTGALATALLALCLTGIASPSLAQLQGTLFTSPEQRAYLDYLRADFLAKSLERGFDIEDAEIPEIPEAVEEEQAPETYSFGGVVSRRDGSQTIWLNGKLTVVSQLPAGVSLVNSSGLTALQFNTASGVYILKPGQTLELSAGSIIEGSPAPLPEPELPAAPVTIATDNTPEETDNTDSPASDEQAEPDPADIEQLQQLIETLQTTLQGEGRETN